MNKLIGFSAFLFCVRADYVAIAGYQPSSDVTEHKKIDLDMLAMSNALTKSNFTGAYYWYTVGGNSKKSSGAKRTISGFSTVSSTLSGEKWYEIYKAYWNDATYANTFTSNACLGKGDFATSTNPVIGATARREGCLKGAQYQNVWMYTIHEMEAAIDDCQAGVVGTHWDEAVAFYVGSTPGASGSPVGYLPYALAERRCTGFGTCDDKSELVEYTSEVNNKVFEFFEKGQDYAVSLSCTKLASVKESIVQQLAIPLIQGTLRYLYYADTQGTEAQRAELWSFAAAILPYINYYAPTVATKLKANSMVTLTTAVPSGYAEVKYSLESAYDAMGITCSDVGGLVSTAYSSGYIPGMESCETTSTSSSSSSSKKSADIPDYGIALIVIFFVLFVIGLLVAISCCVRAQDLHHRLVEKKSYLPK